MFYSMEQEITHYFCGKLHVGQITVRESARSTKKLLEIGALLHVEPITSYFPHTSNQVLYIPWILQINLLKPTNPNKFTSKIHGIYGL